VHSALPYLLATMKKEVQDFCARNGIDISELPSGAIKFKGHQIDLTYSGWAHVKITDLMPLPTPLPKRQARMGYV
jgi:hypothetical protein